MTDVLSGIYYLGAQTPGARSGRYRFPLNDGGKTVDVTAYVEGREDVKTDAGTFHTVRVAVYSDAGPLKGRGKVWLWYTDDASHLPVQMRSHLFWGTMTLRLTRLENRLALSRCSAPRPARIAKPVLLQPKTFPHQALEAWTVKQVVGQFLARKHRQRRGAGVGHHLRGFFKGELGILGNDLHHEIHHELKATDAAALRRVAPAESVSSWSMQLLLASSCMVVR